MSFLVFLSPTKLYQSENGPLFNKSLLNDELNPYPWRFSKAFLEETIRISLAIAKKHLQAVCTDTTVDEHYQAQFHHLHYLFIPTIPSFGAYLQYHLDSWGFSHRVSDAKIV